MLEEDTRNAKESDSLTTEQKLRMTKIGGLYESQNKEEDILSIRIILQSKSKLKSKEKSKYFMIFNDLTQRRELLMQTMFLKTDTNYPLKAGSS